MTTLLGVDLAGRDVLVAGGGPVAALKAAALVRDGALVRVVAPTLCEDLLGLHAMRSHVKGYNDRREWIRFQNVWLDR